MRRVFPLLLGAALVGGCADLPEGAAGVRLSITWAPELALDQLEVKVADPSGALAYQPVLVPEEARQLSATGEKLELVLNPLATARIRVDGLAAGEAVAQARTDVEPTAGSFVEASVFLPANLEAVCGDGIITAPVEECDDGNAAGDDGCGTLCLLDPEWECAAPGEPCLTRCPPGSLHAFLDEDEDGFGAGRPREACTETPLPVGLSDNATDCDDTDPLGWRSVTRYPELDGDGYTGPGEGFCVGDTEPAGYLAEPVPAPVVSFFGRVVTGDDAIGSVSWSNPDRATYPDGSWARVESDGGVSNYLVISGFGFDLPEDAAVRGVEVFVRRDADIDNSAADGPLNAILDASVKLYVGGAVIGDDRARTGDAWEADPHTDAYGGSTDTWGASLRGADVSADSFGVAFAVRFDNDNGSPDDPPRAELDTVALRVWTDAENPDCDDRDGDAYSSRLLATDNDGDAATVGEPAAFCFGSVPPEGVTQLPNRGDDCDDDNSLVYPGQTGHFGFPAFDDGLTVSWDYDCDGEETVEPELVPSNGTGCTCAADGGCDPADPIEVTPAGSCGDEATLDLCEGTCADGCFEESQSITLACR